MKIAYAFRRTAFYPYQGGTGWEIPPREVRGPYLRTLREIGFEGIEIGVGQGVGTGEAEVRELGRELADAACPASPRAAGAASPGPRWRRGTGGGLERRSAPPPGSARTWST